MASKSRQSPNLRMTRAKRAVVQVLAQYFVLRSKDVAQLLRKKEPNQNDIRTINRSLKLLADARLVHRIKYLDLTNDGVGYACGLTDGGVSFAGQGKTLDDHSARTLDHELEISQFHIALRHFCDHHSFELRWQQSDLKHGVNPDAYFSITDPRKESKNTNHFFLEVERAKLGNYKDGEASIIRKLKAYYEYYNSDKCEKHWGFRTYRVIVVLRNNDRRANLLQAMQAELKHRMFWLSVEGVVHDFRTPKGDTYSLSDL
jgi:hypothetical protein